MLGHNTNTAEAKKVTGDPDLWQLFCKAFNPATGEYHSTKILVLQDGGCLICIDTPTPEEWEPADGWPEPAWPEAA